MNVTSTDAIRSHFPALERLHGTLPVAYFDGPGGTQVPRIVGEAMLDYLFRHNANTHWAYASSAETDALLEASRDAMADFLGCDAAEVAFGANMTSLTYHLSRALGRSLSSGDEIVVTRLDHQANVAPWKDLARDLGLSIREVPFDPATGRLDLDAFDAALSERTRIVALGAASNALGTVTPLEALVARARELGAFTFVDAVHSAPHELPDAHALGCDALACSPYKFYGPHLGALFVRADRGASLDPHRLPCADGAGAARLETGTLSHEAIVGAGATVDYLAGLADADDPGTSASPTRRERLHRVFDELGSRSDRLLAHLWSGLEAIDGVRLFGPRPGTHRTSTLAFTVAGVDPERVTAHLSDRHGVFTSHGDFYASTVVEDLGVGAGGLVRAGLAIYSNRADVDRLIEGVADARRALT